MKPKFSELHKAMFNTFTCYLLKDERAIAFNFEKSPMFVAVGDDTDQFRVFPVRNYSSEDANKSVRVRVHPLGRITVKDKRDGEYYEAPHGPDYVCFELTGFETDENGDYVVGEFRVRPSHYYDQHEAALIWLAICEQTGIEPTEVVCIPGAYNYWFNPNRVEEHLPRPIWRVVWDNDLRPVKRIRINPFEYYSFVTQPAYRTFLYENGVRAQFFVNVLRWKVPFYRSYPRSNQVWIERWEERALWRIEAIVDSPEKPVDLVLPGKTSLWRGGITSLDLQGMVSAVDGLWVLGESEHFPYPKLVYPDGQVVEVVQELEEPQWVWPSIHQLSHEEIEGGVPKISLTRIW